MQSTQPQQVIIQSQGPIEVYKDQEEKTAKKEGSRVTLVFGCCLFLLCALVSAAIYFVIQGNFPNGFNGNNSDNAAATPTIEPKKISDYSNVIFPSTHEAKILPTGVTAYQRADLILFQKIVDLSVQKRWSGNFTDQLGFSYRDFEQEFNSLVNDYSNSIKGKQLSSEMIALLVTNGTDDISSYIKEARSEFLTYLSKWEFNEKYKTEIEAYVLPDLPDRYVYMTDNFDNTVYVGSSSKPLSGDYGRRVLYVDPHDIYINYLLIKDTMFGQRLDQAGLIRVSTKMIVYKEMGNILMQSFINLNVPEEVKRLGSSDMWKFCTFDFLEYSKDYFWAWQYNKEISDERIATGLMLKAIYERYQLDNEEKQDYYDLVIEKDNYNINTINSVGEILHTQYDSLIGQNWGGYSEYLEPYFIIDAWPETKKATILEMLAATNRMPKYIGAFNPSPDKDLQFFKR